MAIEVSVTGVVEAQAASPVPSDAPPRHVKESREQSSTKEERRSRHEYPFQQAKRAYQQQTDTPRSGRPALVAQDLMSAPVVSLPSEVAVGDAAAFMKRRGIHHLPVTSLDGTLVGMFSVGQPWPDFHASRTLAEVMQRRVFSATPSTEIRDIARVMLEQDLRAIPVLDGTRRPIGIVTVTDLLRGLANHAALELWT
jgi:acetoin utilization protein AcuB